MELLPLFLLFSDTVLVTTTALLLIPIKSEEPVALKMIRVFMYTIALIIFAGIILGLSGFLSVLSFFLIHGAILTLVIDWRVRVEKLGPWDLVRQRWLTLGFELSAQVKKLVRFRDPGPIPFLTHALAFVVGAFLLMYFVQAILAAPLNYDSNTYRLTRISYWLQEGSIQHFSTNDLRHNYTPYYADLLMLWVVSFFQSGYPLVHLVQFSGGLLLLTTLWGWGNSLALPPFARFLAMLICLGMPNVNLQFYTSQTDLITSGLTSAAILFLWLAFRQPKQISRWISSGFAFGLALGAKATVLYWGPALCALFITWWIYRRTPLVHIIRGGAIMGMVIAATGGMPFLQNHATFGNLFAPESELAVAHHGPTKSRTDFAFKNLAAYVWQNLEPNSNPRWIRPAIRPFYDRIGNHIHDWPVPSISYQWSVDKAMSMYSADQPNEDVASFGVVPVAVVGCCMLILLLGPPGHVTRDARIVALTLGFAALGFLVYFSSTSSFTPFKYRYMILLAPALSLAIAVTVSIRKPLSLSVVLFLTLHSTMTAGRVGLTGIHHGLLTALNPARSGLNAHRTPLKNLAERIGHRSHPIGIALPKDSWIAPLFRQANGPEYEFIHLSQIGNYATVDDLLQERNLSGLIVAGDSDLAYGPDLERFRYWIHTVFLQKNRPNP